MTNHGQNDRRDSTDAADAGARQDDHDQDIEKDAVWDLLLEAGKPEVSPFFARNVLREVRQLEESASTGMLAGLKSIFTLPRIAFAAAAALALAVIVIQTTGERDPAVVDTGTATTTTTTTTTDTEQAVAVTSSPAAVDDASPSSSDFDIGDYQEEIQMIDYLDGLLAVQNVEALDDQALAEILF